MGSGKQRLTRTLKQAALALCFAVGAVQGAWGQSCHAGVAELRGDFGQARFGVELADDNQERARGLMFRETMPLSAGMLFVYDRPQRASFWMKNTYIPLDMIFLNRQGVVTRIHENAKPRDLTPIDGGDGVFAVLEINGGLSKRIGFAVGDQMRHPAFGKDAAWSCD